jgi:hypothetical protein
MKLNLCKVNENRLLHKIKQKNKCIFKIMKYEFTPCFPSNAVIIIDTTYFGRDFGVMLFLNASSGVVLHRKFVRNETNTLYHEGLDFLDSNGTHISAVVCDGRTGLLSSFAECPVQMCQFHQLQIVRRLLTSNPRLIAGRELLTLCVKMKSMGKAIFSAEFDEWCEKWRKFLSERTLLVSGKTTYTHRKLRSARKSIIFIEQYINTNIRQQ